MDGRRVERLVAVVLPLEKGSLVIWLPRKRLGSRPVREKEERVAPKLVLLGASDLQSAVERRRAKPVSRVRVRCVDVGAWVDHERLLTVRKLKREQVVV